MAILFANGAVGTLTSSALTTDTVLHLTTGQGSRFPNPSGEDYFVLVLQNGAATEIVHCTSRAADALTVVRAQEGTTALGWAAGTVADMRVTAGLLQAFLQFAAGTALAVTSIDLGDTGTLTGGTLNGVAITNADISLSQIMAAQIKPADGNTGKSIRLPNGGGQPTVGAPVEGGLSEIFTQQRVNDNNLHIKNGNPTLFMVDSDTTRGGGVHVNGNYIWLVRMEIGTENFATYANGRHPLQISLDTGDVVLPGWTFSYAGNASSALIPDLSAKLTDLTNGLATQVTASSVQDGRIINLSQRMAALEQVVVHANNGSYPDRGY